MRLSLQQVACCALTCTGPAGWISSCIAVLGAVRHPPPSRQTARSRLGFWQSVTAAKISRSAVQTPSVDTNLSEGPLGYIGKSATNSSRIARSDYLHPPGILACIGDAKFDTCANARLLTVLQVPRSCLGTCRGRIEAFYASIANSVKERIDCYAISLAFLVAGFYQSP